jgi:GAF domain-containing protein
MAIMPTIPPHESGREHGGRNVQTVVEALLSQGIELSQTKLGNVQLLNLGTGSLDIQAQNGFKDEFLNFFQTVHFSQGSACARAMQNRTTIVVEDVLADPMFGSASTILLNAGVRAVQSIPLVSSSGAFIGVLSTHFLRPHRSARSLLANLEVMARNAANAIIRIRANGHSLDEMVHASKTLLRESKHTLADADRVLAGGTFEGSQPDPTNPSSLRISSRCA